MFQGADAFLVRRAEKTDRPALFDLFEERQPGTFRARHAWLYESNPHGAALTWLAFDRATGRLAGATSVFPRKTRVHGRTVLGSVGGDCYVRPAFRRMGLATLLHSASAQGMGARDVEFMAGPPNSANFEALVKSGAHAVGRFGIWSRPLSATAVPEIPRPIAAMGLAFLDAIAPKEEAATALEALPRNDPEIDRFFDLAARDHPVVGVRDAQYLRWRYSSAPAQTQEPFVARRDGSIRAFISIEICARILNVIDLFCANDDASVDLALKAVVAEARRRDCLSVVVSAKSESRFARRLLRHGFVRREQRGFQVMAAQGCPPVETLLRATSWHFTPGDEDLDTIAWRTTRQAAARLAKAS